MSTPDTTPRGDLVRERVASNLTAELRRQRWSDRAAATALGLTNNYVSRRTSGAVELSVSDIDLFTGFLKIPVATLFEDHSANRRTTDYGGVVSAITDHPRWKPQVAFL